MALEHTFLGTWEIISCTFEGKPEVSGLEGIKFRLDDSSDITWYNDLVSPQPESKDCNICCDSASVLFSCESFDVNESNPRLIFGAFAGHSIEFKTNTLTPTDTLVLYCENWYALECKRLKEGHAAGQEKEFSFAEPLTECYFSDVIIKSSDALDYHVHSSVLRLSGFDCSMCVQSLSTPSAASCNPHEAAKKHCERSCSDARTPKAIKISVTLPSTTGKEHQESLPRLNLSPIYLQPPAERSSSGGGGDLSVHRTQQLSSSFNCLPTTATNTTANSELHIGLGANRNSDLANMRRCSPFTSSSDSHLETSEDSRCKNIFNFCQDMVLKHSIEPPPSSVCNTRRPPLSPYRARSPSPFPSSAMDTPPSSPLTPVGVLNNLPAFMLTPILHWIYTESLMPDMDEDVCEKLINFAETQPSLTRMVTPTKKYLELILLKKFVVNIIMDLHSILHRTTQTINPITISHEPHLLYATFKDCLRDCAIGCAKVLQFCNIFIKDAADISRYQKNEIIKYIRTRIPLFMTQFHQLLKNVLNVFISLDENEKLELVDYLVPEIESILSTLTSLIEEIKNSLEKMCKDLKCSHLDLSMQQNCDDTATVFQFKNHTFIAASAIEVQETSLSVFGQPPHSPRPQRPAARRAGLTLYADNPPDKQRLMSTENDLKFVLYMYEVRKMRDIYGRIAAASDIIRDKKTTFCEMDFPSKRSTIQQNLEQLIQDIPSYIFIMENLSDSLDEKLGRKEFKFCFKLATSQINGVIVKLFDHKAALKEAINQICKLVKKREFTQSMIDLGLLEPSNILQNEIKSADDNYYNRSGGQSGNWDMNGMEARKHVYELNLIEHLCEPPTAANSNLSKNALRLLHSAQLADMEFEVHTVTSSSSGSVSLPIPGITVVACAKDELGVPQTHGGQTRAATAQQPAVHIHTFRAHRVIVSSRCEWFKMALLSGMQESFTRKIIITDTSPVIFRRLLLYLYGAPIDKTVGAEQICELMLLADRYSIDDLKTLCENTLNTLIDEDSVVCLLGIAERYRADVLKNNCFVFLQQHANITRLEIFKELPRSIQLEAKDRIHWYQRAPEPWGDGFKSRSGSRHSLKSPSKPRSRSRKSSPSYI